MGQKITYAFGPFRLETDTQFLCHESENISLQPKVYRLLLYFLEHPGRLISREELFDAVWHGTIVEDTALRLAVNALRRVLRDDCKTPCFIFTACKRGYRFLPDVTVEYGFQRSVKMAQEKGIYFRPKAEFQDNSKKFETELEQLLEAFEQASDGKRSLLFLHGERSTGKTALLERFLAQISHPEYAFLRARCVPLGGFAEPFLPLLEALERRCREPCGKLLIDCLHQIAPTWLYQIVNMLDSEDAAKFPPNNLQISSERMLREGANFFERLGTESTFILILDNSHWSDKFTLDLLNFLVFRRSPARLLIILSFRSGENSDGARQLEKMRNELCYRGLCRELSLHSR